MDLLFHKGREPSVWRTKASQEKFWLWLVAVLWFWRGWLCLGNGGSWVQCDLQGAAQVKSSDYSRRKALCLEMKEGRNLPEGAYSVKTARCCSTLLRRSWCALMEKSLLLFIAWCYWSICLSRLLYWGALLIALPFSFLLLFNIYMAILSGSQVPGLSDTA